MRTNHVPKHSQDYADPEYISRVWVNSKKAEFISNKQIHSLINKHTVTQFYIIRYILLLLPLLLLLPSMAICVLR